MEKMITPCWLEWAREIQALAQSGVTYSLNDFQTMRYHRLMEIAAEIINEHTGLETQTLFDVFREQKGYATPKVGVRGAVFRDGKILLVREISDGGWTMPGGWVDVGDRPAEAVEREVWEESGFRVKARRVVGVYDANRFPPSELFHAFRITFLCELLDGEATPSNETSEVAFFAEDDMPAGLSFKRTGLPHIRAAFAMHADPSLPTVFD